MSPIYDKSSDYTGSLPDYPCLYCTRSKHCTMTVTNDGSRCEMFTTYEAGMFEGSSPNKIKNYTKRNHHKKKSYHRGKF